MVVLVTIPSVPESDAVELTVAHVIALYLAYELPILPNFTKHVILMLHP